MTRRKDVFPRTLLGNSIRSLMERFLFFDGCLLVRGMRGSALRTFLEDEMSGVQDARSDP